MKRPSRRLRRRVLLLFQKVFSASGISPDSRGAWLFLGLALGAQGQHLLPCFKGKGEGGADGDGEVESRALASQCLAEVQALCDQGGIIFIHCSHFFFVLLNQ